eukprot:TRINITY_DN73822_c0_g1_i1.p1 TRINITY_DN73822_c0_g1~~TRINITY_DN73822_c0_g1_i1.p1  ORF type:complete len:1276 (+),score=295.68 TRINITY_DN73822_c0_g1_i1:55-3828(+)
METSDCETVRAAFHAWDLDKNGVISKIELATALDKIGMDLDATQITRYFDQLSGGSGEIDADAFVTWVFTDKMPNTAREKVREALGIDGGEENEDGCDEDDQEEDDEEEDDEEDEQDEEEEDEASDEEDEEDDADDDDEETPIPSPAKAQKSRRAKGVNKKPAQIQNQLNNALEEISRLKAELEEKAKQELERKKRKEQKAAEKEQMEKLKQAEKEAAERDKSIGQTDVADTLAQSADAAAVAAAEVPAPVAAKSKAKKKAKGKDTQEFLQEGVVCSQEIQMGEKQQVRSALGVGDVVWTIDWGGTVSVRDRHDAKTVKAVIHTGRFVSSMLHIAPSLMWLGQEQQGIKLIDSSRRVEVGGLTGGHTSLISCLCADESGLGEEQLDGTFAARRVWSGSDDFTIRLWHVVTWRDEASMPEGLPSDAEIVETAGFKTAVTKGLQLYGHKNKVKSMVKVGPCLWTGSDDGTIRIWNCADSLCKEVINAHRDGVHKLTPVKSSIWSAGYDGLIREWSNHLPDGDVRVCQRSVAPQGFEKGVYDMVPLGQEVWTCGHHPSIQVLSQRSLEKTCGYDAHEPYVSKLIPVDRVVTKTIWSTSFADGKLKVWNHVVRDDSADTDALTSANKLYLQSERNHAKHIEDLARMLNDSQAILNAIGLADMDPEAAKQIAEKIGSILNGLKDLSPEEQASILDKLAKIVGGISHLNAEDVARALDKVGALLSSLSSLSPDQMVDALDSFGQIAAALSHLPPEKFAEALEQVASFVKHLAERDMLDILQHLPALVDAFDGLKHLLKDPNALARFMKAFVNQGMEHLVDDPVKMEAILKIFNDLDIKGLLEDRALNEYMQHGSSADGSGDPDLKRALSAGKTLIDLFAEYKDLLEGMGLEDLLNDPSKLRKLFEMMQSFRKAFEENGFDKFLKNPAQLAEFLSNYRKIKAAFDECGLGELLEDPYSAKGWLKNYTNIQRAFEELGLDYLLSSAGAMRDFLAKHAAAGAALEGMGDMASRLSDLEKELQLKDSALQRAIAEKDTLQNSLQKYEGLGTIDELRRLKDENIALKGSSRAASDMNSRVRSLERELANKEQERLDALAREKVMFSRYKELDVFKLDIIARELKGVLKKVEITEKRIKQLKDDSNRFKDYGDRKQAEVQCNQQVDCCRQTEAHIHDVILKCFSETQRRHIGIASNNEHLADDRRDGRLLDGGQMIYKVEEEMEMAAMASLAHVHGTPDIERPDYGSSRAAPAYRSDAFKDLGAQSASR